MDVASPIAAVLWADGTQAATCAGRMIVMINPPVAQSGKYHVAVKASHHSGTEVSGGFIRRRPGPSSPPDAIGRRRGACPVSQIPCVRANHSCDVQIISEPAFCGAGPGPPGGLWRGPRALLGQQPPAIAAAGCRHMPVHHCE